MFNNFNNNRITINTADFKISNVFYANSDDANGRILEVQLTDNGLIADSTGYSLELGFSTSQNTTGLVSFTVVDYAQGLYKIEYPTSMMIPGDVTCELRIFYLTNLTVSRSFIVNVSESVINEETITATNDFSALTTALGSANEFNTRITLLEQASDNGVYLNHDANGDVTMPYFTDADKLGGYDSSYYAKQADLDAIVADVTVDSEVILARNSNLYGAYGSLDARLEAIEGKEKTDIQGVNIAIANSETAIKDLAEASKSVIPDVKVSTYSRSSVLSSNAREGQMNVKVSGNTLKNEVVNGNFANGTTGWENINVSASASNNVCTILASVANGNLRKSTQVLLANHKYYLSLKIKATSSLVKLSLTNNINSSITLSHTGSGNYELISGIVSNLTYTSNGYLLIQDTRTSGWDNIYIKDVICIDMGSDTSNPLYNKTTAEMDAMTPYYFDGFSDVKAGVVKTIGKNLFDKSRTKLGYGIEQNGSIVLNTDWNVSDYIKINPSTQYTKTNPNMVVFYDVNKNYISGANTSPTFITPSTAHFARFAIATGTIDTFQLKFGSIATTYEPYTSTTKYLPYASLKSLPNGAKDYIDGSRYVKNISDYINYDGTETWTNYTGVGTFTNTIVFYCLSKSIGSGTWWCQPKFRCNNFNFATESANPYLHDVECFGYDDSGNIIIRILKSKLSTQDINGFKTWLQSNNTKVIYQLNTPIITEILPNTVKSSPNGSVQYLNVRGEVGYYGTNIAVTNSSLPIKSLTSVKKISIANGSETNIDLATCTIASGGLSFTSTALTSGDLVDWNYEFDSALSTTPLIDYEYNNNTFIQEPWNTVSSFLNGWLAYDTANAPKYRKTSIGEVKLKGIVKSGTINANIFELPVGYRPLTDKLFPVVTNGTIGYVRVTVNGAVFCQLGNNAYVDFSPISFFID